MKKVVMDEGKMRLSSLFKFSAKILLDIISVLLMNFVGWNGELNLLPLRFAFIPNCKVLI